MEGPLTDAFGVEKAGTAEHVEVWGGGWEMPTFAAVRGDAHTSIAEVAIAARGEVAARVFQQFQGA